MNRVAWRSVRAHAKQFFLTTFAVVLGVAFLSGTLALRASMSETFSKLTSSTITSDLYVQGPKVAADDGKGGGSSSSSLQTQPIDGSLAEQIKRIDGVEAANPGAQLTGVLVGANDTPVSSMGAPTLFLPLYDEEPGLTWAQGHRPQGGGEIPLESGALKNSGLKVGDETHIVLQGQPTEVTVVGEFHFESSMASATVVGMDPDWLLPIAAPDGRVSGISIDLADGASVDTVKSEITKVVPDGTQVKTRAELIKEQNKTIEEQLGFIQVFLLVFVVVAMFVGSFIIMNSFAMSVRQRVKEFALLRAVGASPASVFGVVFLQAVVIGIVVLQILTWVLMWATVMSISAQTRWNHLGIGGVVLGMVALYLVCQVVYAVAMILMPVGLDMTTGEIVTRSMLPELLRGDEVTVFGLGFVPASVLLCVGLAWWAVRALERHASLR